METSADINEAKARLNDAQTHAMRTIDRKIIEWTDAYTSALSAITKQIEGGVEVPDLDQAISAFIVGANQQTTAKMFVCGRCFHSVEPGEPIVVERTQPTARVVHYPSCPTTTPEIDA